VPNIGLQYFDVSYVKYLLMLSIETKIAHANRNNSRIMTIPERERLGSVLKWKGGKVSGLGDVELLSACDLARQSSSKLPFLLSMAVSADDNLNRVLLSRTQQVIAGPSYEGETNPTAHAVSTVYMWQRETKKMKKANARAEEHRKEALAFMADHINGPLQAITE
jgi:hypothetical protein